MHWTQYQLLSYFQGYGANCFFLNAKYYLHRFLWMILTKKKRKIKRSTVVLSHPGLDHNVYPKLLSLALVPKSLAEHRPSRASRQSTGALTALWTEGEPVPSSSSGSWSSLSVQEDTSSVELVRSGRLLDVSLRRSSAEFSCGETMRRLWITLLYQGQGNIAESTVGGHVFPVQWLHGVYVHISRCARWMHMSGVQSQFKPWVFFPLMNQCFLGECFYE